VGTAGKSSQERVSRLGAQTVEYGPGLADRIRAIWPDGADVAFDTVGTDEAIDVSLELVADPARIATINAFEYGAGKGILMLGGGPGADPGSAIRSAARPQLVELAGDGKLTVDVSHTFPLEQTAEAIDLVYSGKAGGKVVIVP
jgi:NADPH:quinone reductase-like Zn-dependent oxidoreductase